MIKLRKTHWPKLRDHEGAVFSEVSGAKKQGREWEKDAVVMPATGIRALDPSLCGLLEGHIYNEETVYTLNI